MEQTQSKVFGAILATLIFAGTTIGTHILLDQVYGQPYTTTSVQTITLENSGQRAIVDNVEYDVAGAELIQGTENENVYRLKLTSIVGYGAVENEPPAASVPEWTPSAEQLATKIADVPASAYEKAQTTGEPVTIASVTTTERAPLNVLPIAASIGVAVGFAVFAVWIGYRQAWGEATSTLLEHGLHDMTVRDIEVVGYIMQKGEFTIPELMKMCNASKLTVWRTVQKLVEQGLVKTTDQTKPAANGLGGRGKPSQIYKYVGKREETPKVS